MITGGCGSSRARIGRHVSGYRDDFFGFCCLHSPGREQSVGNCVTGLGALTVLDALVFPGRAPFVAPRDQGARSAAPCRQGLLEQSARATTSACPRCALSAGPFADLRGGCAVCRDRSLGFDAALALGPYDGEFKNCVCGSSMRTMHGSLRGSVIFSLRQDVMQSTTYREMPGSYRSRCTGGGAGSEVITRPRHWLMGWRDGLTSSSSAVAARGRDGATRPQGTHRAGRDHARCVSCPAQSSPHRPDSSLGGRRPDHGRHLWRSGTSTQESRGRSGCCHRHRADRAANLVGQDPMTVSRAH